MVAANSCIVGSTSGLSPTNGSPTGAGDPAKAVTGDSSTGCTRAPGAAPAIRSTGTAANGATTWRLAETRTSSGTCAAAWSVAERSRLSR